MGWPKTRRRHLSKWTRSTMGRIRWSKCRQKPPRWTWTRAVRLVLLQSRLLCRCRRTTRPTRTMRRPARLLAVDADAAEVAAEADPGPQNATNRRQKMSRSETTSLAATGTKVPAAGTTRTGLATKNRGRFEEARGAPGTCHRRTKARVRAPGNAKEPPVRRLARSGRGRAMDLARTRKEEKTKAKKPRTMRLAPTKAARTVKRMARKLERVNREKLLPKTVKKNHLR